MIADRDLEWYLCVGESACGATGTYHAMVAAMIYGGPRKGGPPDVQPLCDDRQLGWGRYHGRGIVERATRLDRAWRKLAVNDRVLLRAYFAPPVRVPPAFSRVMGRLAAPALALGLDRVDNRQAKRSVLSALLAAHTRWQTALAS